MIDTIMSLSSSRESFWNEHQEVLRRIRTDLGRSRALSRTPSADHHHRTAREPERKASKSYSRTPPPYLPRLDTPPEHEERRDSRNLRRQKYGVVPPVRSRAAFHSPDRRPGSSWAYPSNNRAVDSEGESDDEGTPYNNSSYYMPQPYPFQYTMPVMSSYQQNDGVIYPAVFYPPPPQGGRHLHHMNRRVPRGYNHVSEDYDNEQFRNYKNKSHRPQRDDLFDEDRNPILKKYKVVPGQQFKTVTFQSPVELRAYSELSNYSQRSTPRRTTNGMAPDHPLFGPSFQLCSEFINNELHSLLHDVVREGVNELADHHLGLKAAEHDPLDNFLNSLLDEAVREATAFVVIDTTQELAEEIVQTSIEYDALMEILDEIVREDTDGLLADAVVDLSLEDYIDFDIILPGVEDEAIAVAKETLLYYDNRIRRKQLKEITSYASDKLLDSLLLDSLLSMTARQGKLTTETEHANKVLDGLMLDVIFKQYFDIEKCRSTTYDNVALRKLHKKTVTDVALDVMLGHLTTSLDEDMADVDEYERLLTHTTDTPG